MAKRLKKETKQAIAMGLTAYSYEEIEKFADILDDVVVLAIGKHEDKGFASDAFGSVADILSVAVVQNYKEDELREKARKEKQW